ncbi:MAG TPA: cupin domain-containing protein, partial [Acidimicrobiales bacterium]
SVAGLMRLDPGASVEPHVHRRSHHHVWVVEGSAVVQGRTLAAGSYAHIPAGVRHGTTSLEPDGCTLFYLYVREPSP